MYKIGFFIPNILGSDK